MKIYHTETQEDYDALMAELKLEGCTWGNREIPIKGIRWEIRRDVTCVHVSESKIMTVAKKSFFAYHNPDTPIIKYKAKADEKMKFTKENIYKMVERYSVDQGYLLGELRSDISKLDDTPEKAVVPKCFDEWYQEIKGYWQKDSSAKTFALWKLCQQGFGYGFERANGKEIHLKSELGTWLNENTFLAIDAVLNGYTIEPEQLYCIPLPHLETAGGTKQYLTKSGARNYFALSPCVGQKQRYTKEELERVPEVYKPFAKPIEEEEE